jgi:hypothetical protein
MASLLSRAYDARDGDGHGGGRDAVWRRKALPRSASQHMPQQRKALPHNRLQRTSSPCNGPQHTAHRLMLMARLLR